MAGQSCSGQEFSFDIVAITNNLKTLSTRALLNMDVQII